MFLFALCATRLYNHQDANNTHTQHPAKDLSPDDADMCFAHLALTVLQQSHLCPLPLVVQPVHWAHDAALQLYPLPHALVLAGGGAQAQFAHEGCTVMDPVSVWLCVFWICCRVETRRRRQAAAVCLFVRALAGSDRLPHSPAQGDFSKGVFATFLPFRDEVEPCELPSRMEG